MSSFLREEFYQKLKLESNPHLSPAQLVQVQQLIYDYRDVFSRGDLDLGHTDLVKHAIDLSDTTPFKERPRRIPPGMYAEVREHLQEMLDVGVITESKSPWASNVVLVRKKDNG